jgi:hypothetical protein
MKSNGKDFCCWSKKLRGVSTVGTLESRWAHRFPEEIRTSPALTFTRTAARSVDLFLSRGGPVCS